MSIHFVLAIYLPQILNLGGPTFRVRYHNGPALVHSERPRKTFDENVGCRANDAQNPNSKLINSQDAFLSPFCTVIFLSVYFNSVI